MENASKALLIAAAILIAIVLISLGVMVLGQGSQLVKNADMSDAEITTYNSEFENFLGGNVRGSSVTQLVNKVDQHNRRNSGDKSKQIEVTFDNSDLDKATVYDVNTDTISAIVASSVKSAYSYSVTAQYSSGGLISKINCRQITSK